jgi:hypothetical protein
MSLCSRVRQCLMNLIIFGITTRGFLLLSLLMLYISSCSTIPTPRSKPGAEDSVDKQKEHTVLPRFKTLDTILSFSGIWVNEEYINKIINTRSPRISQGVVKSCIVIPERTLMVTRMIAGFHEGGEDRVVVKDGDKYLFYNAGLTFIRDSIEIVSQRKIRIGNQYFKRLIHQDTSMNDLGILEEILFKGRYQSEEGKEIDFGEDGHVLGLDSFKFYFPVIDYTDGPADVDHVQLGHANVKLQQFGFRFDKDTLLIYKIQCLKFDSAERDCETEALGEIVYRLIKVRPLNGSENDKF